MDESKVIKPTVGRVVHFWPGGVKPTQPPLPAIVTAAWSDTCVNLAVFERNGVPMSHPPTSVRLLQPGESPPEYGPVCAWMPFQVGQSQAVKEAQKKVT